MRTLKNIFSRLHEYILWALISAVFWSWIFTMVTDAAPEKKVSVFADTYAVQDAALAAELQKSAPEGIRMVKVHPFSYAAFDSSTLTSGDVFLVRVSDLEAFREDLQPLPAGLPLLRGRTAASADGEILGILIRRAGESGAASEYLAYDAPGEESGDWALCFGRRSGHLGEINDSPDDAALVIAEALLALPGSVPEGGEAMAEHADAGTAGEFILGMDVSSVIAEENSGVVYRGFDGEPCDLFETLAGAGLTHIRVRVWNDPFDAEGRGYGGGNCDIAVAEQIGRRATAAGMRLIVDFHYSDFWADPGKQKAPKAWEGMDAGAKAEALYEYTRESLDRLRAAGVDVGMVQLGNETTGALAGETEWPDICRLMTAGGRAVREVFPEALIAVHFTDPERSGSYLWYADRLAENGVDYDVFASSYYPFWHGTLENLAAELSSVSEAYGKQVMVMETSYPQTAKDSDFFGNTVTGPGTAAAGHPFTVQGQADAVRDVIDTVAAVPGGVGVVYWEGAWISVGGSSREENSLLWERFGSGWAASFAGSYDPDDAGRWFGGCAVDNQAMFAPDGTPLDSLRVFGGQRG